MARRGASKNHDSRQSQLVRIHMAKSQLGIDEDTYRCLLRRVTGKESSAQMTTDERNAVIAEFVRLGFKERKFNPRKAKPKATKSVPMLQKIEALLADAKRPWEYAHSMSRHMFKVDRLDWLTHDQMHRLIAALEVDAKRRKKRGDQDAS